MGRAGSLPVPVDRGGLGSRTIRGGSVSFLLAADVSAGRVTSGVTLVGDAAGDWVATVAGPASGGVGFDLGAIAGSTGLAVWAVTGISAGMAGSAGALGAADKTGDCCGAPAELGVGACPAAVGLAAVKSAPFGARALHHHAAAASTNKTAGMAMGHAPKLERATDEVAVAAKGAGEALFLASNAVPFAAEGCASGLAALWDARGRSAGVLDLNGAVGSPVPLVLGAVGGKAGGVQGAEAA